MVRFVVPGDPVGKGRPRAFLRGGFIRMHTPDKTARFEERVRLSAQAAGVRPLAGPVELRLFFFFAMPMSRQLKKSRRPMEPKTSKPDLDNLIKAVADALNGQAWTDDAQVWAVEATKVVAAQGEPAHTVVMVMPREEASREMESPQQQPHAGCPGGDISTRPATAQADMVREPRSGRREGAAR